MSTAPHAARPAGFTLIEVLVALFIMSILATLAWRGIDALLRTRDAAQGQTDRSLRLASVIGQWEQDLRQLQRTTAAPTLQFDGAALRLTRFSPEGLRVVVWTVQDGSLHRWTSPPLVAVQDVQQAWRRAQQWSTLRDQALPMLPEVAGWQVYYYRLGDNNWSNAQSSAGSQARQPAAPTAPPAGSAPDPGDEDEDTEDDGTLPTGVRLELTLPAGTLTRDLQLPANP